MWSIFWCFVENLREIDMLVDEVCGIMGAGKWLDKFGEMSNEGKVTLLLGKGVEGVSEILLEEVGELAGHWLGK